MGFLLYSQGSIVMTVRYGKLFPAFSCVVGCCSRESCSCHLFDVMAPGRWRKERGRVVDS